MNEITNDNDKCIIALEKLQNVIDPEIGLNIVDLGLIYQIDFDEKEKIIYCTMTLTTQFCPMGESISDGAKSCLENAFEGYSVTVNLTFDPPWSAKKILPDGQQFLN